MKGLIAQLPVPTGCEYGGCGNGIINRISDPFWVLRFMSLYGVPLIILIGVLLTFYFLGKRKITSNSEDSLMTEEIQQLTPQNTQPVLSGRIKVFNFVGGFFAGLVPFVFVFYLISVASFTDNRPPSWTSIPQLVYPLLFLWTIFKIKRFGYFVLGVLAPGAFFFTFAFLFSPLF